MGFRDYPIQRKLMLVIMATSSVALILFSAVLTIYDYYSSRDQLINGTVSNAQILALNSRATLTFKDRHAAEETLSAVAIRPRILMAGLYDDKKKLFATWRRSGIVLEFPGEPPAAGVHDIGNQIAIVQPVLLEDTPIGTLYILRDMGELNERLWFFAGFMVVMLIGSLLAALAVSSVLQRLISVPILNLVNTAQAISATKDYSLRATSKNTDELGLLVNSFNDMLQQIQTREDDLRTTKQQLQDMIDNSTAIICAKSLDGKYMFVNREFERVLKIPNKEVAGKTFYDIFPKETADRLHSTDKTALAAGRPMTFEEWVALPDGVHTYLSAKFILRDSAGNPYAICNIATDITENKRAEAAMRDSEAMFRTLSENAPIGIFRTDSAGRTIYVNPFMLKMTGFSAAELFGNGWQRLIHPDDAAAVVHEAERTRAQHQVFDLEHRCVVRNGAILWARVLAAPILDPSGSIQSIVGVVIDVTDRKQALEVIHSLNVDLEKRVEERTQELMRSNKDLEAFAYIASHDLQEPLRTVAGCTQILEQRYKDKLDADANKLINYTLDGVSRMKALIDDLLSYSRLGTAPRAMKEVNASTVVEQALQNLESAQAEASATITFDPLPIVRGDPILLTQLFQNLIGNAIKYRGDKPARVQISARRDQQDWIFSVRDGGIGIDSKYHERIFLIFQRLHGRELPGTGVGLAICKRIVEQHGGRIWVESQAGQGATFYVALPAEEGAHGS
jgi:PAS domain S-box-containing protein